MAPQNPGGSGDAIGRFRGEEPGSHFAAGQRFRRVHLGAVKVADKGSFTDS